MTIKTLILILAAGLPSLASAEDDSWLFGLPFDKPMDRVIKACTYAHKPGTPLDLGNKTEYCGQNGTLKPGQKNASVELLAPLSTTMRIPTWVRSVDLQTDENGTIAMLRVKTGGISDRSRVVDGISQRFGPGTPAGSGTSWDRPGVHIYFGCAGSDYCVAIVRNEKKQKELEEQAAKNVKRDKL